MANTLLPDPSVDLDWDHWDGAIHDVFARNAEKYPERPCVTETGKSPRQYNYRQIHEASNVVANFLIFSGIERGDVVMTYAHRNVDLVVAIMGILKTGATFTVLDPQYPENRQIMYLDISEPKGLIVISKAKGSGLSSEVNDWIESNLQLKATIPQLAVQPDGKVLGGSSAGSSKDVLDDHQKTKSDMPNVLVGPDSVPTLSFTSGSEGRPKAVLGRHYSLVYYFPWMAETFGISEHDKFTMLSGIAHDPIQRDIFTPLFLGAQILVPAPEDIQHEKLAEWMKAHKCTVTHLTPAMGQILVGGATTKFPELRNAFFVGDILLKRDVRKLQELAPNVRAINMLGTTETQRAVSYFAIPSRNDNPNFLNQLQGDKIPAGKGMKNVQLLVVDRQNPKRLCGIDETGEIYIRAAGLAEGYLGLDGYTKEKFITNWFVEEDKWIREDKARRQTRSPEPWRQLYKGPRDRMYRTGDLGFYTKSGDVECTGRADSQVKIRGFRIELGEIDSCLASSKFVRESVTMLRRDENEEHQLVSYVVPEMSYYQEWLKKQNRPLVPQTNGHEGPISMNLLEFRSLRDEIHRYLRTRLPVHSVPHFQAIIPLRRFPLNPNGKIDKPSLPFPKNRQEFAVAKRRPSFDPSSLSKTEEQLSSIWGKQMDIPSRTIGKKDSFFELGGDSLSAQKMLLKVRRTWPDIDMSLPLLLRQPTLQGFASEIDRAGDPQGHVLDDEDSSDEQIAHQAKYYSNDAQDLWEKLPKRFPTAKIDPSQPLTVLVTGATGFLGAYLLAELLRPERQNIKVIAHVRADDRASALDRVKQQCRAFGTWSDDYNARLDFVAGDLTKPQLGIGTGKWAQLERDVDVIVHNGARVHWASDYAALRDVNVMSTKYLLDLAGTGKAKRMTFVSSTSVLDTEYYVEESELRVKDGEKGVLEVDDLRGSARNLSTGYGQSKWVSEYLMRGAGQRRLSGSIVRPGYVLGDEKDGTSITDDFLIRLLKGCEQIGCRPAIPNTVNMCPVTYVARTIVASALQPALSPTNGAAIHSHVNTLQITPHPRMTFSTFLAALEDYGFHVPEVSYREWVEKLKEYVSERDDHALLPLFDYVTADLPHSTRAIELDDTNTQEALKQDMTRLGDTMEARSNSVSLEMIGKYLGYLIALDFMPKPEGSGSLALPEITIGKERRHALENVQGRSVRA